MISIMSCEKQDYTGHTLHSNKICKIKHLKQNNYVVNPHDLQP